MFPRRTLIAICIAAVFSPLGAVLAQETATVDTISTTSSTPVPESVPTTVSVSESVSTTISASESVSTTISVSQPTPTSSTDSLGYYPTIPGQTYDNSGEYQTPAQENAAGADGNSDTFINIPLGAQIAIISIVVLAGVVGLVFGWFWYQRRRRQWEIQGRRRSLVPRISRSARGLSMSRPVYTRDSMAATPIIATLPAVHRASSSTTSVSSFGQTDLEKGNERSEFENETRPASWKTVFSKK